MVPGLLLRDILKGDDPQIEALIRVVQHADADVLVLADIDYDMHLAALEALADRIGSYPFRFALEPNRGKLSGVDLNGDGKIGGPQDAIGYAEFRGQSGLAILSRYPIDRSGVVDLTGFSWQDLPSPIMTTDIPTDFPLSTTGHWSVPITFAEGQSVHILTWHATPPVFDGPEDRNGRRNHDETSLWLAYLDGQLPHPAPPLFVLAGVANLDPLDGDGRAEALIALLSDPRITDAKPRSDGAVEAANADHRGDPALDTADWPDGAGRPGNLRVDYVLPSSEFRIIDAGVLWPSASGSLSNDVMRASRHRLVWG